jgi:dTDP-4-amino-4,6-dideoxygalactose transaminase
MPLHRQPAYRSLEIGPHPETERAASEVLSLPIYPQLRDDQVAYIAEKVVQFHR